MQQWTEPPVALVTGGATRIGKAIVERLARDGAKVIIHTSGASAKEAQALTDAIITQGGQAAMITCDLADANQASNLVARAEKTFGPLTQLVNNAAIFAEDDAQTFRAEDFDRHCAINLRAPLLLAQSFVAQFSNGWPKGAQGAIVNIIDQRVLRPTPHYFTYALSKAGLWAATRTMAQSFAPDVRVNGVGPGPALPNALEGVDQFRHEVAHVLLERATPPEEIAEAVAWLLQAKGVTGQMIALDSGQHLAWKTPDIAETFKAPPTDDA